MASFLKQQREFQASMASAAAKIQKRSLPSNLGTASSTPASSTPQRRTPEPAARSRTVYSQPADTGKGQKLQTQVLYARDHLKEKGIALALDDILGYLSQLNAEQAVKDALAHILRQHDQVEFDPTGFNGKGSYKFKPKHAIKNGTDLVRILQSYSTFKGLPVKELKEGWPNAEAGITDLEREHRVLAVRNKKDNTARTVWYDDPSIFNAVDAEILEMAKAIKMVDDQTVIETITREGGTPVGQISKKANTGGAKVEKKHKKPRRGGKTTNKHMQGILKDFSHLRR